MSYRAEISSAVSVAKGVEPLRDYTSLNAVAAPGSGADVVDQSVVNPDKRLTQEWKASGNDPTVGFDDGPNRSWNWAPYVRVSGVYYCSEKTAMALTRGIGVRCGRCQGRRTEYARKGHEQASAEDQVQPEFFGP